MRFAAYVLVLAFGVMVGFEGAKYCPVGNSCGISHCKCSGKKCCCEAATCPCGCGCAKTGKCVCKKGECPCKCGCAEGKPCTCEK